MRIAQRQAKRFFTLRHDHQMDVVRHQTVGPHRQAVPVRVPLQRPQVRPPVAIDLEHVRPAVAPLRHMVRKPRHDHSRDATYTFIIADTGVEVKVIRSQGERI